VQNKIFKAMAEAKITFIKSDKIDGNGYSALYIMLRYGRNCKVRASIGRVSNKYWRDRSEKHDTPYIVIPKIADIGTIDECKTMDKAMTDIPRKIQDEIKLVKTSEVNGKWLKAVIDGYYNDIKEQANEAKAKEKAEMKATILAEIEAKEAKARAKAEPTLLAVLQGLKDAKDRQNEDGTPIKKQTIAQYNQAFKSVTKFAESENVADYLIKDLDKDFYQRFIKFMSHEKGGKDGNYYKRNTIGKHVKIIKTAVNQYAPNSCEFVMPKKCKVIAEDIDNIYLTEDELKTIANAKLNSNALDVVRDQFILLAWAGQRYSDLSKLNKDNIKGDTFVIRQQKTDVVVTIPILPEARRILDKYGYEMPKVITNQKFNVELHEVCRLAGLNSEGTRTRHAGDNIATECCPKWQLVSAHTARRSYATNMYKKGFPTLMIMKITGHKTEKNFLKYIKVDEEENAQLMLDMWNKKNNI
jgi:integrase